LGIAPRSGAGRTADEAALAVTSCLNVDRCGRILQELVRTRSQNPIDGEGAGAGQVAGYLRELGLEVETPEVFPGRPNVVGLLGGSGGPTLAFNTHMDTVPAGSGWTRDPFGGEIEEGELYGRGSVDAKGPLAAFLAAIEALVRSGTRLKGSLLMTAVVDEETCSTGARQLAPGIRADFAIVGEPTGLQVGIAHRGSVRPVIAVTGRMAHSSRPSEGINAVYQAVPVIQALEACGESLASRPAHALCGTPSAAVTLLNAGVKENVIPERCEIVLDRRLVPGETEAAALAEVSAILEWVRGGHPGLRVEVERTIPTTGSPSELEESHPLVGVALQAAGWALEKPSTVNGMSGACDMTHFRSAGIPCVVLGPGDGSQAHQPDEHIDLVQLHQGAQAYARAAMAICGVEP
jgi:acetylornithine deacetylase/succinyl-diaminopimelate desuccinylase family protein